MKKVYLSLLISLLFSTQLFSQCTVNGFASSPSCAGLCNGRITVFAFGGTAPYTYKWNNGDSTRTITGLCAGTYSVTVKDAGTCDVTKAFTVAPAAPMTATVAVVNEPCFGETAASATVNVTGGTFPYTYSWSTTPVQNARTARNLPVGTYTVTVTAGGGSCTATATATITQPSQLVAISSSTNSACDSSTGSVSVTVSGGTHPYSYLWNTTPVSTTSSVTGLSSGAYTVTVRDSNRCTVTSTVTVGNTGGLTATTTQTNVTCRGEANGTAIVTGAGGKTPYSYSWSTLPIQTKDTASGLAAGTYKVTVTDSSGCSFTTQVIITQPARALTLFVTHTNAGCFGSASGTATARPFGGIAPYSYSWSPAGQTTVEATGLTAGTYTVTVTDANSCAATSTVTITQSTTALSDSITSTNVTCYGAGNGTAAVTATGGTPGYTYQWSNGRRSRAITNLVIGTYRVVVTDRNGCTATDSVTITRPPQIIIAVTVDSATCGVANGSASATVTSGGVSPFAYHWLPAGGTNSIATGLPAGVYQVIVTDHNGCTNTASAAVPNSGAGTATISSVTDVSCRRGDNGTATVTMTGGTKPYTYTWNTTPVQTTATASGLAAGTYGVTVRDSNGCVSDAIVTITQPATIVTSSTTHTNVTCGGDSTGTATVNATGGTPSYTYSWNTTPVQTTKTAVNLKANLYTVTVTDANGCTSTSTVRITQPPAMGLSTTKFSPTCYGGANGTASVNVTGGTGPFTYSWSTSPVQATRTATDLTAGTYTVTVTEASGCSATATANVSQPGPIALSDTSTNTTCGQSNGTATVKVTSGGASPFSYLWGTTPVQTTATATGLPANSYSVIVTDFNGCSATATVIVGSTNAATATVTVKNAVCYGQSNGAASVVLTGGTGPFTYVWTTSPIQRTDTAVGLPAGSYGVIVTDHSGCLTPANAVVGQPDSMTAISSVTNVSCVGGDNGSASAVISGGNGGNTYSWNTNPVQTTDTATGLSAGNFVLTVTDSKGCGLNDSVTISQPSQSVAVTASQIIPTCNGLSTGMAVASVTGGNSPYTYSWQTSPVQTTDTATGLAAGTYSVTVMDSLGCSGASSVTVSTNPAITITATPTNVTCFGYANGSDSASASGGTSPYTYSWNSVPVQNTAVATALTAGSYTVTVTDSIGCSATHSNLISQPEAALTLTVATASATCDSINGKISAVVTGGTSPYSYSWTTSPMQTTDTATGLAAGTYNVTVTDTHGCTNSNGGTIANALAGRDSITSVTNVTCYGGNNGSATVTVIGGTKPFTYSWNTSPVQTTATASNLTANSYIVVATDSNGCKSSENVFINQPDAVTPVTSTVNINCYGGASTGMASASTTGGTPPFTYSWNTSPVQSKDTAINLAIGTYTVTVTDSSGCTGTATATITQPDPLTAATSQIPTLCYGSSDGSGTIQASGGTGPYSYAWSTSPEQDSSIAIGLSAGIYNITISDFNGCTATVVDTITQPAQILLSKSSTNTTTCGTANGTATVGITSGGVFPFTYNWSPTGATTPVDSNLSAGIYTVIVTDANNCMDSISVAVGSTGAGIANLTIVNDSCFGDNTGSATVTMTGGTPPFTYIWNTIPAQTTATATGLAAGNYIVSIYDHAGCVTDVLVPVSQPNNPISFTDTTVGASCGTCADGSATITPAGGVAPYRYTWATIPAQTTATATNLLPGLYNFCIIDTNNCSLCDTITVGVRVVGIVNLSSNSDTKMIVYPNPTSGQFTLEFESRTYGIESQDLTVRIISLVGQEVFTEKINQTGKVSKTYNLSDYPKGIYLIQIVGIERVYFGRIILE